MLNTNIMTLINKLHLLVIYMLLYYNTIIMHIFDNIL